MIGEIRVKNGTSFTQQICYFLGIRQHYFNAQTTLLLTFLALCSHYSSEQSGSFFLCSSITRFTNWHSLAFPARWQLLSYSEYAHLTKVMYLWQQQQYSMEHKANSQTANSCTKPGCLFLVLTIPSTCVESKGYRELSWITVGRRERYVYGSLVQRALGGCWKGMP